MQWSCSGLIFLPGSKEFTKKYPLNQEILLIFCSFPCKKIWNPTSPLLISASAQTILTPTENYSLSCLHKEWRSLASSDTISSYSLSNSMYTFHMYCNFANKPSVQTQLWLPVTLLVIPAGEKSKTLYWLLLKIASKIAIFVCRKRKFMSFKGEMNAEFSGVDSKVYWHHRNACFSLRKADRTHYSQMCILVLAHLHTNAYPGVKHPYSQMCIPSNMGETFGNVSFSLETVLQVHNAFPCPRMFSQMAPQSWRSIRLALQGCDVLLGELLRSFFCFMSFVHPQSTFKSKSAYMSFAHVQCVQKWLR